ncbi:MAG TPA: ornithine carbamoyltransferase [Verrucomicrobiales bacterium]|nr:ornithine carbamoyltransferase [Verrucomicrobiales bacterium]
MKHFLSIESLAGPEIGALVDEGLRLKARRGPDPGFCPLAAQIWAMLFTKSSTRTRVSFEVGIRELGGQVMFLSGQDLQLDRGEPIRDTARVLGRMLDGAIIRTFGQDEVEEFALHSGIPTINALTDEEHPCQILADLLTIRERLGGWEGRVLAFFGDGDCNMARSWMWASARLGFELRIAAPKGFQPPRAFLERVGGNIACTEEAMDAAAGADVLYTDVWVSMGKEEEGADRIAAMEPFQLNGELVERAAAGALVMHCLPAYRGKEISGELLELHASTIFDQAENRLHAQKAVLVSLAAGGPDGGRRT